MKHPMPAVWEYAEERIFDLHDTLRKERLDKLGKEGWELVAVTTPKSYDAISVFYFKRPKALIEISE